MKLIFWVEGPLVFVGTVGGLPLECSFRLPLECSFHSDSLIVFAVEFVVWSGFCASPVEGVVLEAADVGDLVWFEEAFEGVCLVVFEFAAVVGPVGEDEGAGAFGFAALEVSDIEALVLFVHLAETVRSFSTLV